MRPPVPFPALSRPALLFPVVPRCVVVASFISEKLQLTFIVVSRLRTAHVIINMRRGANPASIFCLVNPALPFPRPTVLAISCRSLYFTRPRASLHS
jgi:hypothetical protein